MLLILITLLMPSKGCFLDEQHLYEADDAALIDATSVLPYEQPCLDHERIVKGIGCEDNGNEQCVIPTVLPVKDTLRWRLQLVCSSLCMLTKLPLLVGRTTVLTPCSMRLLSFILPTNGDSLVSMQRLLQVSCSLQRSVSFTGSTVGMTHCSLPLSSQPVTFTIIS